MPDASTPPVRLDTRMFSLAQMRWDNPHPLQGHADLTLFTEQGAFVTTLTPTGMEQLRSCLNTALASIGVVEDGPFTPGMQVEGEIPKAHDTATYFDQEYEVNVLKALGLIVIRANLLDHGLIALLGTLAETDITQASSLYYASSNMKARLDQIRSLAGIMPLTEHAISIIEKALIKVKKVSDRRNELFHAEWNFRNGRHRAISHRPGTKAKRTEITVTEKMLILLAEDYHVTSMFLSSSWKTARDALIHARNASSTPSPTGP